MINQLDKTKYLINSRLHQSLFDQNSPYKSFREMKKNIPGIYLINFRVLNKEKKILVYNYIYYELDLCESLIVYLLTKNYYADVRTEE